VDPNIVLIVVAFEVSQYEMMSVSLSNKKLQLYPVNRYEKSVIFVVIQVSIVPYRFIANGRFLMNALMANLNSVLLEGVNGEWTG
jgi:hypothetical protein